MKNKLLIVDLDGTLFDTKDVNYFAYRDAIAPYGFSIEYDYYCNYCNGRHYLEFLPQITTTDVNVLEEMHKTKKLVYKNYLDKARMNVGLVDVIRALRSSYKIALVTTASQENCFDILNVFDLTELFDLILTREDINESKPNPEGFIKAMEYFHAEPDDTIIFEDSEVGLEAAKMSGAMYFKTYKFN